MKREFLEGLGLQKDVIDKIMAENGSDINREKQKAEGYKTQLDTAQQALSGFEGVDVAGMQAQLAKLKSDLEAQAAAHAKELSDMEFGSILDSALQSSHARSTKAVKALLDLDALKASKNQQQDIQAAIEKCRTENAYLFADTNVPQVLSSTPGQQADTAKSQANEALRSLFGKE